MEQDKVYRHKLKVLSDAFKSFEDSLDIKLEKFNENEKDAIKNGQIQKFEYCAELLWKVLQAYINEEIGEDISGPKPAIKASFRHGLLNKDEYQSVLEMIDVRNQLAHIYDENKFEEFYKKINVFHKVMKGVLKRLTSK